MTQIAKITTALEQAISGEPAPSFRSDEFRVSINAVTALTASSDHSDPQKQFLYEQVGRAALSLLLDRFQASMIAQRTLSIMRSDKPDAVC
jgi:hypothetical protein